jgi:hypothetical protein
MNRLEIFYGNAHRVEKAIFKLYIIKKGEYEFFSNYFFKLESFINIANANLWLNATKITYVRNNLKISFALN